MRGRGGEGWRGAGDMIRNFAFTMGRVSLSIRFKFARKLAPLPPPKDYPRVAQRDSDGAISHVLSGFDPLPQRDSPVKYLLLEEPDGEIELGGFSIHELSPDKKYREVRSFSIFDEALDAWLLLRSGASSRKIRHHVF